MEISRGDRVLVTLSGTYNENGGEYEVTRGSTGTVLEAYAESKIPVHGYGREFRIFSVRLDTIASNEEGSSADADGRKTAFKVGDVIDIAIKHTQIL